MHQIILKLTNEEWYEINRAHEVDQNYDKDTPIEKYCFEILMRHADFWNHPENNYGPNAICPHCKEAVRLERICPKCDKKVYQWTVPKAK